jgi:hypothetical protein
MELATRGVIMLSAGLVQMKWPKQEIFLAINQEAVNKIQHYVSYQHMTVCLLTHVFVKLSHIKRGN